MTCIRIYTGINKLKIQKFSLPDTFEIRTELELRTRVNTYFWKTFIIIELYATFSARNNYSFTVRRFEFT